MVGELRHFYGLLGCTTSTPGEDTGQTDPLLDELHRVFAQLELPRKSRLNQHGHLQRLLHEGSNREITIATFCEQY